MRRALFGEVFGGLCLGRCLRRYLGKLCLGRCLEGSVWEGSGRALFEEGFVWEGLCLGRCLEGLCLGWTLFWKVFEEGSVWEGSLWGALFGGSVWRALGCQ